MKVIICLIYLDELDKFNRENTQRLMYELQTFDEVEFHLKYRMIKFE